MFDYLIKKYNVNVTSMIRNGTVAVITMLGVGILFGSKNAMVAFPIALTSTVIGRQNFYVKPLNRIARILALDLIIVLIAFLGLEVIKVLIILLSEAHCHNQIKNINIKI